MCKFSNCHLADPVIGADSNCGENDIIDRYSLWKLSGNQWRLVIPHEGQPYQCHRAYQCAYEGYYPDNPVEKETNCVVRVLSRNVYWMEVTDGRK